jgi:hypothetical protein
MREMVWWKEQYICRRSMISAKLVSRSLGTCHSFHFAARRVVGPLPNYRANGLMPLRHRVSCNFAGRPWNQSNVSLLTRVVRLTISGGQLYIPAPDLKRDETSSFVHCATLIQYCPRVSTKVVPSKHDVHGEVLGSPNQAAYFRSHQFIWLPCTSSPWQRFAPSRSPKEDYK